MTLELIEKGGWVDDYTPYRVYESVDTPGAGFSFECDLDGKVYTENMSNAALENLKSAMDSDKYVDKGIEYWGGRYWEPDKWRCLCGEIVQGGWQPGRDFSCEHCDRMYNAFGQELAPVEQWGYETGEHYIDIMNARR